MAGRTDFDAPLPVQSFSDNFKAALTNGDIVDLKQLITRMPKQAGDSYWQQSYRAKGAFGSDTGAFVQEGAKDRPSGAVPRRQWEAIAAADQTFAAWHKRLTPHQDVDFYMTLIDKAETETGHEFESRDRLDMNNDPTSAIISTLAKGFKVKGNQRIIDAITASTSTRKMLDLQYYTTGTTKNTNFGKIKTVTENWSTVNPYSAYTTANEGYVSIEDDLPELEARLDACNVPHGSRKIILINPFDAGKLKTKNFKDLFSRDFPFVKNSDLVSGNIPEMFGFSWVKCNQIPKGEMVAFIPEAIALVPYLDLEQALDRDIMLRNHIVYYAHEEYGVGRIDDIGAMKITIKTAASSGS
jgi:hypothetical protein|nr:MAG TPA: capsid protein [Caudoviricetes sp.]